MKRLLLVLVILSMAMTLAFAGGGRQTASATAISVEIFDRGTDGGRSQADNNMWTNWIKDKVKKDLNIDVTFVPVGRWSETTDIVNLMASGSAPDLCYSYDGGMIQNFRDQGGILNLAPFIDSNLPDTKILLGDDPVYPGTPFVYRNIEDRTQITVNARGSSIPATARVFSIPSFRVALAVRNVFIRQDWLTRLNIPLPTNINQFHDALIAFRDRDPGGVGANRVVPYAQNSDARWGLGDLISHYVDPNLSDRDRWVQNLGSRDVYKAGYKEGVRTMNQWYNERLIYQDFPLMTTADDLYNQMKSGVVGAFCQNWDLPFRTDYNINLELARNVPGAEFVAVNLNLNNKEMMDKPGLQIFIPAFAKNPNGALAYLNWLSKYENYHFLQVGELNVNHTLVNGVPNIFTMPAGHPWFQNSAQNIDMTMPMNGVEMGSPELNARVLALSYGTTPPERIVDAYAASTANARAPSVWTVPTTVNQYGQVLADKADALIAQAITARPADFDRIWDAGLADFMASGGQEVLADRGRVYPAR